MSFEDNFDKIIRKIPGFCKPVQITEFCSMDSVTNLGGAWLVTLSQCGETQWITIEEKENAYHICYDGNKHFSLPK